MRAPRVRVFSGKNYLLLEEQPKSKEEADRIASAYREDDYVVRVVKFENKKLKSKTYALYGRKK